MAIRGTQKRKKSDFFLQQGLFISDTCETKPPRLLSLFVAFLTHPWCLKKAKFAIFWQNTPYYNNHGYLIFHKYINLNYIILISMPRGKFWVQNHFCGVKGDWDISEMICFIDFPSFPHIILYSLDNITGKSLKNHFVHTSAPFNPTEMVLYSFFTSWHAY